MRLNSTSATQRLSRVVGQVSYLPPGAPEFLPRRGIVILAVLVVLVVLALSGYQYSEMIGSEYKVTQSFRRAAEARALADSGVAYATALLSDPITFWEILEGNPYDNPNAFQDMEVPAAMLEQNRRGRFSIITPIPPMEAGEIPTGYRFGVIDEGGKINPNAMMKLDRSGKTLLNALMKLPNMTEEVAASIVDWLDSDDNPRPGGAENQYYLGLVPPYRCKNGPLDSIEEMLLIKGVTPQLLFGQDKNRNGTIDDDEHDNSGLGLGWSAYLTVHSRELNIDTVGQQRVNVNEADLATLITNLQTAEIDEELATYIVLYRVYGGTTLPSGQTAKALGNTTAAALGVNTSNKQQKLKRIASLYDLIESYIAIAPSSGKGQTAYMASPMLDTARRKELLPIMFDKLTTSKGKDIFGRVNVNTAPREVLLGLPGLTEEQVDKIMETRLELGSNEEFDPIFTTPGWLITEAGLPVATVKKLERYVTTRSQVYRMQVLGYFEGGKGPMARLEVVVDTNGGRPRIVYQRDLSDLGWGFNLQQNNR